MSRIELKGASGSSGGGNSVTAPISGSGSLVSPLALDLATNPALEVSSNALRVKVDGSGVATRTASGLLVPMSPANIDNPAMFTAVHGADLGYDQEFARTTLPTTLPTGWAAINGNSGTYLETDGKGIWSMASGFNSVSNISFVGRNVPTEATYVATAKVFNKSYRGVVPSISTGILLTDGTIGYGIFWNTNPLVLTAIWSDIASTFGSNPGTVTVPEDDADICYWRLIKASAAYHDCTFQFSYDGVFWFTPTGGANLDVGATLTPTKIGFMSRQGANAQAAIFDWFRVR